MTLQPDKPKRELPKWLLLPLILGISLIGAGYAMPSLYPTESLWTEADAKQHTELALQSHAAHHASANAQINQSHTVKQDMAKAQYYRDEYNKSAAKLRDVREGGNQYGWWLMTSGIALTALGVVSAMILRRE
jgi:hypothetical protein